MPEFQGFPLEAFEFYDDLEFDNSREFWQTHKGTYDEFVRRPMEALTTELAAEFGQAKIFRPYRDVRFAKDKTPYKTHQGAFVETGTATGLYVQVSADGIRVGAGFYAAASEWLAAVRAAIDDDKTGRRLARIITGLEREGWETGGQRLKTAPRNYSVNHPRIDLLRHTSLTVGKTYDVSPEVHSPQLAERVRADWRQAKPLIDWLAAVHQSSVDPGRPHPALTRT